MPAPPEPWSGLIEARYANHFQVGHNEYEFVFDFGQLHGTEALDGVESAQVRIVRIVMGPPFAKALLAALGRAMSDHERAYGPVDAG